MKDTIVLPILASGVRKLISQKCRSGSVGMKLRRFSYGELVKMTNNFHQRIAQGGFGNTYCGEFDGAPVAVKLYRNQSPSATAQFKTEVNLLNKIFHKNVIKVVGYHVEPTKSALVFEFMANGDLKKHLTGSASTKFTWERRLRIAIDLAKALDYLHDGCVPPIIHRDFNSSNILLSENFEVKLSGFALAVSFIPSYDGESRMSISDVAGTFGYLDPEYMMTGKLSIGTDVYGFGIVLMEMITGRPPIFQSGVDGVLTHKWVSSNFANGEIERVMDPKLERNFDVYSVEEALKIAFSCLAEKSNERPTMGEVLLKLKHCLQMETANHGFNQTISVT